MAEEYLTHREHDEFRRSMTAENKRLEDENVRQNHRIEKLEKSIEQLNKISTSVEKLAVNMENMLNEQILQGQRLHKLEAHDGEKYRKYMGYLGTTILGIIIALVASHFGIG